MQYRKFGNMDAEVSALGFGMMRLPVKEDGTIQEEEAIRMLRTAIDRGVNYVDTAYPYHNGMREVLTGKALQDGYREKVYLATKLPMWAIKSAEDFDRILNEQLEKLQTDHIDFYLFHGLNRQRYEDLVVGLNLFAKVEAAKAAGKIRHIGFSFHDNLECFKEIVDGYDWEFCQIQFNYININYQAGLEGLRYAAAKGMGVVIMEPLLGGKLANPPKEAAVELPAGRTPVEWALDYLWNQPEVSLLLSGMSTSGQVEDNLTYADRAAVGMLTEEETAALGRAKAAYDSLALVPCTNCKYCMPCPFGLEIPKLFEIYNEVPYINREHAAASYAAQQVKADMCKKCHRCEQYCPQNIKISGKMTEIAEFFQ